MEYSEVIKVTRSDLNDVRSWPNPFKDKVNLQLRFLQPGNVRISLYSNEGRLVKHLYTPVIAGLNNITFNQLKQVVPGVYLLEVRKDGTKRVIQLIKE